MTRPKIFVSYSAREEDPEIQPGVRPDREIAEQLVNSLKENDEFDPWWDELNLEAGDNWNEEISKELTYCHGAIVLLSGISKDSQFCRHEAGYLSVRKFDEDADFPLLVYRLRGLTPEAVGPFFQAIDLGRIQSKPWDRPNEEMFAEIKGRLDPAKEAAKWPDGPKAVLEEQLAADFSKESISLASLRYAASQVDWIKPEEQNQWGHPKAVPRLFVRRLLAAPIEEQYGALDELGTALEDDERERIFELVAPFWIEERAANQFKQVHEEAEFGKRAIVTNGTLVNFTPMMFARRFTAHKDWKDRKLLPDDGANGLPLADSHSPFGRTGGELKTQALNSILYQLGLSEGATPAEISAAFKKHRRRRKWVYSILTGIEKEDLEDLAKLVTEFGEAVFIVLTGSKSLEIPDQYKEILRQLEPPFRSDDEQIKENPTRHHELTASDDYYDFREALHDDS